MPFRLDGRATKVLHLDQHGRQELAVEVGVYEFLQLLRPFEGENLAAVSCLRRTLGVIESDISRANP